MFNLVLVVLCAGIVLASIIVLVLIQVLFRLKFSKDVNHCYATINLNNTLSMSGDQIALMNKFSKHNSWLYLGGIPQENVKDFLPVHGFVGCMNELKVAHQNQSLAQKKTIFSITITTFRYPDATLTFSKTPKMALK